MGIKENLQAGMDFNPGMNDLEWAGQIPRELEVGDRIELVNMPDDPDPLKPGTKGTVTSIDNRMDIIGVKWDNGRNLNLVKGVDSFNILNESSDSAIINKSMPKPTLKKPTKMRKKFNNSFKKELTKGKVKDIKVEGEELEGGLSDNLTVQDLVDKHNVTLKDIQKEIEVGMEVEMEHTGDPMVAKEIVMDHIYEYPDYYTNAEYGLVSSEKKLEENFFGGIGNAFGKKKNKDDQYDNEKLGQELKRIMDVMKTSGFKHRDSIQKMLENFREKYSGHSRIDDMMKSLYYEFDQLGEIDETTSAGSAGAYSGPLFGGPIKKESRIIKLKNLIEGTTTTNTGKFNDAESKSPFDENKDGWFWNDKPWYSDGEIVDDIAQLDHNWKDELLSVKMTKESLIKSINMINEGKKIKKKKKKKEVESDLDETTTSSSSGQYSTPVFAAKNINNWKSSKKPIIPGGQIIQKIENSGVLSEINKVKYNKDGEFVSFDPKCVKYKNQPWCSQGAVDKPIKLSKTTTDNISEVAKKLGISEEEVKKVVINKLSR